MNDYLSKLDILPIKPIPAEIHIDCEEITLSVNGVKIKADLPSLENVDEIIINGFKFVRRIQNEKPQEF